MLSHKILITSPRKISISKSIDKKNSSASGFEKFKEYGFNPIEFPTIKIVQSKDCKELDSAIKKIDVYDYLIFTSKNSVDFFMKRFFEAGKTKEDIKRIKICAIGTKTAEEIKKWKIKVDLIPDEFNAEGLVREITREVSGLASGEPPRRQGFKGLRFLLPRGEKARETLPEKIRKLGGKIDSPVLYKTVKPEVDNERVKKILDKKFSAAAFTSASAFDNFTEMIGKKAGEFFKNTAIVVIGPVTAKAVRKAGFRVSIMPRTATIESMANEMIRWLKKNKKCVWNR